MNRILASSVGLVVGFAVIVGIAQHSVAEPPRTGPETERRFPPLKLPEGFKATLFACDPLIEYPSALCAGRRTGEIFVAIDYMTGLGTEIVRRDEIRLVVDDDGDGYADTAAVFADGFNSIMGLAWHNNTLYVMHAPFFTALRDRDGDGRADERKDLLQGLGLPPEENDVRLHCANGVVAGHDGWLYLALGDHGCDVARPEGDRLVLEGGGILRCRADGRDLHVFARGLRNIYDIALDAELNVFVRDNENDGGTYKIRMCQSFHGADHGYPYLYEHRPDEALPPLADLGLGSAAGGLCYLEQQFPAEYQGSLLFCEWGRAVMRFPLVRDGSSFAPAREIELAAGAGDDTYGFKPTDVVVQRDGTLVVADWADGQRPQRGRGRIYTLSYLRDEDDTPQKDQAVRGSAENRDLAQLNSPSYFARCDAQAIILQQGGEGLKRIRAALDDGQLGVHGRSHAVWILAQSGGAAEIDRLLRIASADDEPIVRAQAVRAIADLADPVFLQNRLAAGAGDRALAKRLVALGDDADPRVQLEIVVATARLRWSEVPPWLDEQVGEPNAPLAHAAMMAMRQSENWTVLLELLDRVDDNSLRAIAMRAVAERYEAELVDGLIARLKKTASATRRQQYAESLARVYKRPGPWVYWGYRPGPRPANTIDWERTSAIARALGEALTDRDIRWFVLQSMRREQVPVPVDIAGTWLVNEDQADRVAMLLTMLREQPPDQVRPYCEAVVRAPQHSHDNRLAALELFVSGIDEPERLLSLASELEDGPVVAAVLRQLVRFPKLQSSSTILEKLDSPDAQVQAAAIDALGQLQVADSWDRIVTHVHHDDVRVRRAAARAAGKLSAKASADALLKLLGDDDVEVRRASFTSLRLLGEERGIPQAVAALSDRQVELAALEFLGDVGSPDQAAAVTQLAIHRPTADVLPAAVRVLNAWHDLQSTTPQQRAELDRAVGEIQGASGTPLRWRQYGPLAAGDVAKIVDRLAAGNVDETDVGQTLFSTGAEAHVVLGQKDKRDDSVWLATTSIVATQPAEIELLAASSGSLRVWLDGKSIYTRSEPKDFAIDADRFSATLVEGDNRLIVEVGSAADVAEFHLRFRRKSAMAKHESLIQAALSRQGNVERGRAVLMNSEKSQCLKCHRVGDRGERIGPELSGVGSRFSRIYLVESILEPGRAIAPSYESVVIALSDGKVLTGVLVAETETTVTIVDNQAAKHTVAKADIDERRRSPLSTMPEALADRLTEAEFVDLVSFLANEKEGASP